MFFPKFNLLVCFCALTLGACATVPNEYGAGDRVAPLTTEERIQAAARNAAIEGQKGRIIAGALRTSETAYRANPKDAQAAIHYAHDLRTAGMIEQAALVLQPFANNPKQADSDILVEYAKIKLSFGDFEGAQIYGQEAVVKDAANPNGYHVLGIAVDAQGHHQASENHFKKAMGMVTPTDPLYSALANNLALSLLAQGKKAEAESMLLLSNPDAALSSEIKSGNAAIVNAL